MSARILRKLKSMRSRTTIDDVRPRTDTDVNGTQPETEVEESEPRMTPKQIKAQYSELLDKTKKILQKPNGLGKDELPVSKDLPRLARHIVVWNEATKSLSRTPEATSKVSDTRSVLQRLSVALLNEEDAAAFCTCFEDYFKTFDEESSDLPRTLELFWADEVSRGAGRVVLASLRAVTQSVVAPSVILFKQIFHPYRYKDQRGTWTIRIEVEKNGITVAHRKREQSALTDPQGEPMFKFLWRCELKFDRSGETLKDLVLSIGEVAFSDDFPENDKTQILESINLVLRPTVGDVLSAFGRT